MDGVQITRQILSECGFILAFEPRQVRFYAMDLDLQLVQLEARFAERALTPKQAVEAVVWLFVFGHTRRCGR